MRLACGLPGRHAPHCLKYMEQLRNKDVFRFCAIPQVMAIGTLALCYNNHAVFTGACCRLPPALQHAVLQEIKHVLWGVMQTRCLAGQHWVLAWKTRLAPSVLAPMLSREPPMLRLNRGLVRQVW